MSIEIETLVPCPSCTACRHCKGTGMVDCYACATSHKLACAWCDECGVCRGVGLVSVATRVAWMQHREQPYGSAS